MKRALQLARNGEGRVSPNPMVGAVIVHEDRIIGEGFHAYYGGPHAEVNAVNSVKKDDEKLLKDSTIYVTLEPCAHYGKTPPCANLIVSKEIPRVVIGSLDPNPKVAGKGIKILEEAGIRVSQGILENECRSLNRRFMRAHVMERPWILLKWAQSADGFMATYDQGGNLKPVKFSNPLTTVWMHRERASSDAILIGANTERIDSPRLDNRFWGGNSPKKLVAQGNFDLQELLRNLRKEGITSLMVEGGPKLLGSFINEGLYDELRMEVSPHNLGSGLKSPSIPDNVVLIECDLSRGNIINRFSR